MVNSTPINIEYPHSWLIVTDINILSNALSGNSVSINKTLNPTNLIICSLSGFKMTFKCRITK